MFNISKTFCILPFVHLSTRTNGDMQLCCHCNSSGISGINHQDNEIINLKDKDPKKYWNTDFYKSIRKKLLNNKIPEQCKVCFNEEKLGYKSKRLWENEEWSKKISFEEIISNCTDGESKYDIKYLDLKLGNNCNFECITCNAADSSRVYKKFQNIKLNNSEIQNYISYGLNEKYDWFKNNPKFWNSIYNSLDNIQGIYIIGGEPTINKEFDNLLEKCIETGNANHIKLRFNTNGSTLTNKQISMYKEFKEVIINLSLDGIEEYHEKIRRPSKWKDMLSNIKRYEDLSKNKNITVDIDCTVSILNINHIPDFIKWKLKNLSNINSKSFRGLIGLHLLYYPKFLSIKCLSEDEKKAVTKKFQELKIWLKNNISEKASKYPKLDAIVNHINSEDWFYKKKHTEEYLCKTIRN